MNHYRIAVWLTASVVATAAQAGTNDKLVLNVDSHDWASAQPSPELVASHPLPRESTIPGLSRETSYRWDLGQATRFDAMTSIEKAAIVAAGIGLAIAPNDRLGARYPLRADDAGQSIPSGQERQLDTVESFARE